MLNGKYGIQMRRDNVVLQAFHFFFIVFLQLPSFPVRSERFLNPCPGHVRSGRSQPGRGLRGSAHSLKDGCYFLSHPWPTHHQHHHQHTGAAKRAQQRVWNGDEVRQEVAERTKKKEKRTGRKRERKRSKGVRMVEMRRRDLWK